MIKTIQNPPYFTLVHKKSGRKVNTFNCDFISYDSNKFDKEDDGKKQNKLL